MQTRMHEQMEVEMQVTQGYLTDVTSTAMQLQTAVAEISSNLMSITTFARILRRLLDCASHVFVGVIILLAAGAIIFLWRFSRWLAIVVMIATSEAPFPP